MLKYRSLWLYIGLACLFAGCQKNPRFVHYPQPQVTVDFTDFEQAGCPIDEQNRHVCEASSPLSKLGCEQIREPPSLIGALEPSYPIVKCYVRLQQTNAEEGGRTTAQMEAERRYIFKEGGLFQRYIRYVIIRGGQFELIDTEDKFRSIFAPIETSDEALSYALALRGDLVAYYDLEFDPDYEYLVHKLEDTHVDEIEGGYLVHLYYYQLFGCGPHFTFAVDLQVTRRGYIEEVKRKEVYKDPDMDGLCVD